MLVDASLGFVMSAALCVAAVRAVDEAQDELRAHVRRTIDACMPGGRYALGSGNTICNYVPIPNYFAMVEEALNYAR